MALEPTMERAIAAGSAASFGWEMWLLCTSVSVSLFSLLLLLVYSWFLDDAKDQSDCASEGAGNHKGGLLEEEVEQGGAGVYHQLGKGGSKGIGGGKCVAIPFPEKEDKFARFKRWARCLRKKPPAARPPISVRHVEVSVSVAIEAFVHLAGASAAGCSEPLPLPGSLSLDPDRGFLPTPSPPHRTLSSAPYTGTGNVAATEVQASAPLETTTSHVAQGQAGGAGSRGLPLRIGGEQVRECMLQFLIHAGPPSRLCAIWEERAEDPLTGAGAATGHTPALLPACLGKDAERTAPGAAPTSASSATTPLPKDREDHGKAQSQAQAPHQHERQAEDKSQDEAVPVGVDAGRGRMSGVSPLMLDGEEVLRVGVQGHVLPFTREHIWAALAALPPHPHPHPDHAPTTDAPASQRSPTQQMAHTPYEGPELALA